jgi:DNA ligase-1
MRAFAALCAELDEQSDAEGKLQAIGRWLAAASPDDAAWGIHLMAGGRPRRALAPAVLRREAAALAGVADWLLDACHQRVGDLAETIALVLPPPVRSIELGLAEWMQAHVMPLRGQPDAAQVAQLREWLAGLQPAERWLLLKLVGGGLRIGVSRPQLELAVARHAGLEPALVAQRLADWMAAGTQRTGNARPGAERLAQLLSAPTAAAADAGRPLGFMVHADLPNWTEALGDIDAWRLDWHFDGLRAQAVRRAGRCWIWTSGNELVTERFPEVVDALADLPDGTVLEGQLVVWHGDRPGRLDELQPRLQRKTLARRLLVDAPVRFVAGDLLEAAGSDLRALPLRRRLEQLSALLEDAAPAPSAVVSSVPLVAADWAEAARLRANARQRGAVGLLLRHAAAAYGMDAPPGRGEWGASACWLWRAEPSTLDAVLVYAQSDPATGRWTDCSFAVWSRAPRDAGEAAAVVEAIAARQPAQADGLQLVPVARSAAGLTDDERARLDACIRASLLEKFGPVRSVRPSLVVTLAFDGVARSPRHKSGIALREVRMLRLRPDMPLHEAGTLDQLTPLLETSA